MPDGGGGIAFSESLHDVACAVVTDASWAVEGGWSGGGALPGIGWICAAWYANGTSWYAGESWCGVLFCAGPLRGGGSSWGVSFWNAISGDAATYSGADAVCVGALSADGSDEPFSSFSF